MKAKVKKLFEQAEALRIGSAFAGAWGNLDHPEHKNFVCVGKTSHLADAVPVTTQTLFDLASLTKIVSTTAIVMVLVESGQLDLDSPLEKYLPEEAKQFPHLKQFTLKNLLSHTSGLPAWRAYYEELKIKFGSNLPFVSIDQRKSYFYSLVLNTLPDTKPGERMMYSDVGFLLVGYLIEKISNQKNLKEITQALVWDQISKGNQAALDLQYRPVVCDSIGALNSAIVATEICPWRGLLQGQVHDDNAWSMGGVSPHAGVFGSIEDVVAWAFSLFQGTWVTHSTLQRFFREVYLSNGVGSRRSIGFDMPSLDGSGTTGNSFSIQSVGHLGFTGTSLWIDLNTGDYACLLTNRVHPDRSDLRIRNLRINFHSLVRS